jgi:hypothetical protein
MSDDDGAEGPLPIRRDCCQGEKGSHAATIRVCRTWDSSAANEA